MDSSFMWSRACFHVPAWTRVHSWRSLRSFGAWPPLGSLTMVLYFYLLRCRCASTRPGETGMDVTSRCTLGDPNKLPEGVPQPARMPYISDKHPRQTLEVINLLRKHRELCDVVLVVGAKKIYAHRVILSACSPYFRAMFTGELAESRQTEVVIRDIDERAMELLIDFAYTSQITVEEGNVQTLLPAACLLQLAEIQEACCEFLKRQLDPSNCLGIRAFADTHSCRELLRIADKFTQHNFQEVRNWNCDVKYINVACESFQQLSFGPFFQILPLQLLCALMVMGARC